MLRRSVVFPEPVRDRCWALPQLLTAAGGTAPAWRPGLPPGTAERCAETAGWACSQRGCADGVVLDRAGPSFLLSSSAGAGAARCSALPRAPRSPLTKAGASPAPSTAPGGCGGAPRRGRGRRERARGCSAPLPAPPPGSPPRAALLPRRLLLRARGRRPR